MIFQLSPFPAFSDRYVRTFQVLKNYRGAQRLTAPTLNLDVVDDPLTAVLTTCIKGLTTFTENVNAFSALSTHQVVIMSRGNFAHGEYFINCDFASLSFLRGAFGVWISVFGAVVAACVRTIYRSRLNDELLSNDPDKRQVKLWRISPATSPSEIFQQRLLVLHAFRRRHIFYAITSLFCIVASILGAASTTIANHAVVKNIITRQESVPGRLVTHGQELITDFYSNLTSRIQALDNANAPLDQLFDFVPDDSSDWIFVAEQWNNSWRGNCQFNKYPAVDLTTHALNVSDLGNTTRIPFQTEVPALGNYIPQWATVDPLRQSYDISAYSVASTTNDSGIYKDGIVTYAFGTAPNFDSPANLSTVNISFANFAIHNIGRGVNSTFVETSFKSDVYVADCMFNNAIPGARDQARADGGLYDNVALGVASIYRSQYVGASFTGLTPVQPTAQQMMRNFQAFLAVKDAIFLNPVHRTLSVKRSVVQIRASVLFTTLAVFVVAAAVALFGYLTEARDQYGERFSMPRSQLDWIVQAAREHHREDDYVKVRSPESFLQNHEDLAFVVSTAAGGHQTARVISTRDENSVITPFLDHFDPLSLYLSDKASTISGTTGH